MGDSELDAIRQARLQQLKQQSGNGAGATRASGGAGRGGNGEPSKEDQEAQAEYRHTILATILSNEARERLARIAIVRPDRARGVEDLLISMAQRGQLGGQKVSEPQLIGLLDQISQREGGSDKQKITVSQNIFMDLR